MSYKYFTDRELTVNHEPYNGYELTSRKYLQVTFYFKGNPNSPNRGSQKHHDNEIVKGFCAFVSNTQIKIAPSVDEGHILIRILNSFRDKEIRTIFGSRQSQ